MGVQRTVSTNPHEPVLSKTNGRVKERVPPRGVIKLLLMLVTGVFGWNTPSIDSKLNKLVVALLKSVRAICSFVREESLDIAWDKRSCQIPKPENGPSTASRAVNVLPFNV